MLFRLSDSPNAWRLRGSTTLDGDYDTPANIAMVFLRSQLLGLGLPTFDSIPQLACWKDVRRPILLNAKH
jgi:hypothetical protein